MSDTQHGKNLMGTIRIQLCAKSFILQMYDILARHKREDRFPDCVSSMIPRMTVTILTGF